MYLIAAGSVHDYKLFKQLFNQKMPWFSKTSIFLDLGFYGANSDYGNNIKLPHKRKRKSKKNPNPVLSEQQVSDNKQHARNRIFVEHSIGGMKSFHCLMHMVITGNNSNASTSSNCHVSVLVPECNTSRFRTKSFSVI